MRKRVRVLAALAGFALATTGAGEASAQKAQWEQDQVMAAAKQLASAVKGLRDEVRKQGRPDIGAMQSRSWMSFTDDLRLIESEAKELASALADGRGHDETLPVYQRLQMLVRSARDEARSLMLTQPVQQKIDGAREALRALEPFYDL